MLDPEQNKDFVDHYLEVPFDLSFKGNVHYYCKYSEHYPWTTRGQNGSNREISGYTELEKLEISKKYLLKKQLEENGLDPDFIKWMTM